MRQVFAGILTLLCVFMLSSVLAAENQMGIADSYRVNFVEKFRVADTMLPQGTYQIRHVMEGSDHIMVFRQLGKKNPIEVRAKCTLVPLDEKAVKDERIYELNAANERVLQQLIFKGDRAKHVF
ncbi:MAG: hypothetical protein ABSD75_21615 [Terriglobales bacterium]|jgi:hypothetical protein